MVRLIRYAAVSLVATTTSLVTLGVTVGVLGLPAAWSNLVATAVGTVPSFELNRRWVWVSRTGRSFVRQVAPFCALSLTGLAVSTAAVGVVSNHTQGWSHWGHTIAVEGANASAYGSLWMVQYVLLDRVLFGRRRGSLRCAPASPAFTVDQPGGDPPPERTVRATGPRLGKPRTPESRALPVRFEEVDRRRPARSAATPCAGSRSRVD